MTSQGQFRTAVQSRMQERKISRRQLARETGLDKGTVGRFLDGDGETRRASVVAICVHLDLPIPPVEQQVPS